MAPVINIASIVSVEVDGVSGLFVMDSYSGRFYRLHADEVPPETAGILMAAVRGQMRADMPHIPHDEIAEVMKAERGVAQENRSQIFKGGF